MNAAQNPNPASKASPGSQVPSQSDNAAAPLTTQASTASTVSTVSNRTSHERGTYQYYKTLLKDKPFPLAFVDMDTLDQNIAAIKQRAGNKTIRIASKSVRCLPILRYLLESDPIHQGLMCFTVAEALWLSSEGLDDLMIGYPSYETQALTELARATTKGKQIYCMIDSPEHVAYLNNIAASAGGKLLVCVDGDMSIGFPGVHFGVHRSPLTAPEKLDSLIKALQNAPYLELVAFMGYEAAIAGVGDKMPGKGLQNTAVGFFKKRSVGKVADRRAEMVARLKAAGFPLRIVNGGGTGSMEWTREEAAVTEITVGSGFYASHLFDYYSNFRHQPAAGFGIRIVRQPKPGMYTALGGGYIASGAAGKDKQPSPWLPTGTHLTTNEGAGEVQTPFTYKGTEPLQLGDPIFLRHSKAGELCERFNTLYLIRDGEIEKEVPTYRGEGKAFL